MIDLENGAYKFKSDDSKYFFTLRDDVICFYKDGEKNSGINTKQQVQRMLTLSHYRNLKKVNNVW